MTTEPSDPVSQYLRDLLTEFECVSGTIHRMGEDGLELVAHEGIPKPVLDRIGRIPVGKGMAGIAAEREKPVQVCNLQTDDSGVAEAGARETGMEGSIAAPIFGADGELVGVLGVGKAESYEFSDAECELLLCAGERIAPRLQ